MHASFAVRGQAKRTALTPAMVGCANHQLLAVAAAGADAIAAGTWLNVRSLDVEKFYTPEEQISRRAVWYYCPQVRSEFKLNFLDIAQRNDVLQLMRPDTSLNSHYADPLFSVARVDVAVGHMSHSAASV